MQDSGLTNDIYGSQAKEKAMRKRYRKWYTKFDNVRKSKLYHSPVHTKYLEDLINSSKDI